MHPGAIAIWEEPHLAVAACCSAASCCLIDRSCSCSCSLASLVLCPAWACSALQHVAQQVMPCSWMHDAWSWAWLSGQARLRCPLREGQNRAYKAVHYSRRRVVA